jgi:hypothetical protein
MFLYDCTYHKNFEEVKKNENSPSSFVYVIADLFHQFKIHRNANFQQMLTLLINFIFTSSYGLGLSTLSLCGWGSRKAKGSQKYQLEPIWMHSAGRNPSHTVHIPKITFKFQVTTSRQPPLDTSIFFILWQANVLQQQQQLSLPVMCTNDFTQLSLLYSNWKQTWNCWTEFTRWQT